MPWSRPAHRMREYVGAVRAIWACWKSGERLRFGELRPRLFVNTPYDADPQLLADIVTERGQDGPPVTTTT